MKGDRNGEISRDIMGCRIFNHFVSVMDVFTCYMLRDSSQYFDD